MGQGEGGETSERKCNCSFFTQSVRQKASGNVTHDTIRQMTISKPSYESCLHCLRSTGDELNLGTNLCAFQFFVRGTYGPPLSASGVGSSAPLVRFPLSSCHTFAARGHLPSPTATVMLLEVTFSIGTHSTFFFKKYIYFRLAISHFIKLRTSLLESYLGMKFLFHPFASITLPCRLT